MVLFPDRCSFLLVCTITIAVPKRQAVFFQQVNRMCKGAIEKEEEIIVEARTGLSKLPFFLQGISAYMHSTILSNA